MDLRLISNTRDEVDPLNLVLDVSEDVVPSIDMRMDNVHVYHINNKIYSDTTANWNAQPYLIGEKGSLYIYTDAFYEEDEVGNITYIPAIKVGDGASYLIDNPFVSQNIANQLLDHIQNRTVHITEEERQFWNNKVAAKIDNRNPEGVLFYTTLIPPDM